MTRPMCLNHLAADENIRRVWTNEETTTLINIKKLNVATWFSLVLSNSSYSLSHIWLETRLVSYLSTLTPSPFTVL